MITVLCRVVSRNSNRRLHKLEQVAAIITGAYDHGSIWKKQPATFGLTAGGNPPVAGFY